MKDWVLLHIALLIYSIVGIFSKNAAKYPFLSKKYIMFYCGVLAVMFIYAVIWQQILKKMQLNIAYGNRAIVVVWGVLWGILLWGDRLCWQQVIGLLFIILGIVFVGSENGKNRN